METRQAYEPSVSRMGIFDAQVCVPADWTDEQARMFLERKYPCGTMNGWTIRKEGSERLKGDPERRQCAERQGFVHIMFDA